MQNFSNESVNIHDLPKFEAVNYHHLNPKYRIVILFNLAIFLLILIAVPTILFLIKGDVISQRIWLIIGFVIPIIFGIVTVFSLLSFKNRGYAFRNHDVLFKSGVISSNIIIIPYNRVQHIAVHQGFISRYLGLATVEIFTAGGNGSDLSIPGLEQEEAEKIKQLVMSKLNIEI